MKKIITLIDYGIGNIYNVKRAFEYWGAQVHITCIPAEIEDAALLVLPGVGAFDAGMRGLAQRHLINPILNHVQSGKLFLGICLGMQLLFDESTEFGNHQGLGIIPGKIVPVLPGEKEGRPLKVPHIGWSQLDVLGEDSLQADPIFTYAKDELRCYFVHSFTADPTDPQNRLADTHYGDAVISAIVKHHNVYGCQFHPEKSGKVGLALLKGLIEYQSGFMT